MVFAAMLRQTDRDLEPQVARLGGDGERDPALLVPHVRQQWHASLMALGDTLIAIWRQVLVETARGIVLNR